jgi:hypothetical protein
MRGSLFPCADPSQRLSVQQVLRHPWCRQGIQPQMLTFNDAIVARSLANPPPPQVGYCQVPSCVLPWGAKGASVSGFYRCSLSPTVNLLGTLLAQPWHGMQQHAPAGTWSGSAKELGKQPCSGTRATGFSVVEPFLSGAAGVGRHQEPACTGGSLGRCPTAPRGPGD